jgi:hypothetical protein
MMPTLGEMKSHLSDDLDDTSATYATQIARAITRSIEHLKKTRFAFNESRSITITTVIGQSDYTTDASANPLSDVMKLDGMFLTDTGGQVTPLSPITPQQMQVLLDNSASTGEPYNYTWYANALRIYPLPDAAYTLTLLAWYRLAAPSSDGSSNAWTNEAYDLVKARALYYLASNTLRDPDLATMARIAETEAEEALIREMNSRNGTGYITPTCF